MNRSDPGRFFGDGVVFKAKLIGILEVGEARGDRMCQEALQDLKIAIRAAGEHKQRITIHVTIDGLRLRDEKGGDSLYHHPVHKISFIAQDMTDSRAFGYIFGSPDSGHRFFGIKTDKAASQVVLAMRDLFQVVFELKKKEIELARQQIQNKTNSAIYNATTDHPLSTTSTSTIGKHKNSTYESTSPSALHTKTQALPSKEMSPESVADLVDLEQELSSLQRGITQLERITPNEPAVSSTISATTVHSSISATTTITTTTAAASIATTSKATTSNVEDPFGDSFTSFRTYNLLPPPESSKSRQKALKQSSITDSEPSPMQNTLNRNQSSFPIRTASPVQIEKVSPKPIDWSLADNRTTTTITTTSSVTDSVAASFTSQPEYTTSHHKIPLAMSTGQDDSINSSKGSTEDDSIVKPVKDSFIDAFTDLDPLGTGKSKPYVDKKYFFQELKNPPKKVLKDLSEPESIFSATFANELGDNRSDSGDITEEFTALRTERKNNSPNSMPDGGFPKLSANFVESDKTILNSVDDQSIIGNNKALLVTDNDPFSPRMKTFQEFDEIFSKPASAGTDPFVVDFSKEDRESSTADHRHQQLLNGSPLQVILPPEIHHRKPVERNNSDSSGSIRMRPSAVLKQSTVDVISSIGSKKMMKQNLFGQKFAKRESNQINMRRLHESDSMSETETAPEPPPRPDTMLHVEPPPLPPKKQFSDIIIRPRVTSPLAREPGRYDYITATTRPNRQSDNLAPALPAPSRRIGRTDAEYPGPDRPMKNRTDDDYLTPIGAGDSMLPILLPPPQVRTSSTNRSLRLRSNKSVDGLSESETIKPANQERIDSILPDITLSQLLTLGIDELALKLNVPVTQLNQMTIVELTQYISHFIEKSNKTEPVVERLDETEIPRSVYALASQPQPQPQPAIFKVNFDQFPTATTFIAKFDDNFGEEMCEPPKSVDKYAAFREIIDQDLISDEERGIIERHSSEEPNSETDSLTIPTTTNQLIDEISPTPPKIDTKITEAISHAKDRYAALRDIILVENLFNTQPLVGSSQLIDKEMTGDEEEKDDTSSPEILSNIRNDDDDIDADDDEDDEDEDANDLLKPLPQSRQTSPSILSNRDDMEINELMHRTLSNLSLGQQSQRDISIDESTASQFLNIPQSKSPSISNRSSPRSMKSPMIVSVDGTNRRQMVTISRPSLADMSTSPIQLPRATPQPTDPAEQSLQSMSDKVVAIGGGDIGSGGSDGIVKEEHESSSDMETQNKNANNDESWAVFEPMPPPQTKIRKPISSILKSPRDTKEIVVASSPCSSDEKPDWKAGDLDRNKSEPNEYEKRWPTGRGHHNTSSSSRDVSPWDDEGPPPPPSTADYRSRSSQHHSAYQHDRTGYYERRGRRIYSCDDEFDDVRSMHSRCSTTDRRKVSTHRSRQHPVTRSREDFDGDQPVGWYHSPSGTTIHHTSWSPADDDDASPYERGGSAGGTCRSSYRNAYERPSSYESRNEPRSMSAFYDRKSYESRMRYRDRSDYSIGRSPYNMVDSPLDHISDRKISYYEDYEQRVKAGRKLGHYDDGLEGTGPGYGRQKLSKEYFYDRDKRSFDRESLESYDSRSRRKSFESGDMYDGSMDDRDEEYPPERYTSLEKIRAFRKHGRRHRSKEDEFDDQESESGNGAVITGVDRNRRPIDLKTIPKPLQDGLVRRPRKSSGSSPWDGEELPPTSSWKRPSSASESDRRLADARRIMGPAVSGSDGEKDRRVRKRMKSRGKDIEGRPNYATMREKSLPQRMDLDFGGYDAATDGDVYSRSLRRSKDGHPPRPNNVVGPNRRGELYIDRNEYYSAEHLDDKPNRIGVNRTIISGPCVSDDFPEQLPVSSVSTLPRNANTKKYQYDEEQGFDSDFNTSLMVTGPTTQTLTINNNKSLRFSNDFSEKEAAPTALKSYIQSQSIQKSNNSPNSNEQLALQKLRFDDNIAVAKYERSNNPTDLMFEDDDFSKAKFTFTDDNQTTQPDNSVTNAYRLTGNDDWVSELPRVKTFQNRNKRSDDRNIRKSESINIFAKKSDDPFEDDDFFSQTDKNQTKNNGNCSSAENKAHDLHWESNFAKFD